MPAKQVLQFQCDRCTRVWYVEPDKADQEPLGKVEIVFNLTGTTKAPVPDTSAKYECLCESCRNTVKSLLEALLRPGRSGAKKKKGEQPAGSVDKGADAPKPTEPTKPEPTGKPPNAGAAAPLSAPSAHATGAGGAAKVAPAAASPQRPTRQ